MDATTPLTLSLAVTAWVALLIQWKQFQQQKNDFQARIISLEEIEKQKRISEDERKKREKLEDSHNRLAASKELSQKAQANIEIFERYLGAMHLYMTLYICKVRGIENPIVLDFLNKSANYVHMINRYEQMVNEEKDEARLWKQLNAALKEGKDAIDLGHSLIDEMQAAGQIILRDESGENLDLNHNLVLMKKMFRPIDWQGL